MKMIKEYFICDRCNKTLTDKERNFVVDYMYAYDLCDDCTTVFKEYRIKLEALIDKEDKLNRKYKFRKYLKENEMVADRLQQESDESVIVGKGDRYE